MKKRTTAVFIAALMAAGAVLSDGTVSQAAPDSYVTDDALSDNGTAAPEAWGAVPNASQYQYQKEELAAFCHFGPNTFNEVEWGENYGDKTPDEIFCLEEDFDAETLVSTLKDAGFKKLIVTAKHHDGFCIWASDATEYDVSSTSYKDGQGDILAEISAVCTKYDMNMGLYLSPWDIHEPSYGYYDADGNPITNGTLEEKEALDALDYNDYYNSQLEEILGNDAYGNNGHFCEIWMDGAKGSGASAQEYDFDRWIRTIQKYEGKEAGYEEDCLLFGAGIDTTVAWIGNENGTANEETWSKGIINSAGTGIDGNTKNGAKSGYEYGTEWIVMEADARITSGWFWGTNKKTPKSLSDLANMYFNTVGHNATLLLNIPPNNEGTIDEEIKNRVIEFGNEIHATFETNLAADASAGASEVRGMDIAFKAGNVLDGDDNTYWTTEDGTTTASLVLDLEDEKTFDVISIEEAIQYGQRIKTHKVEYRTGDGEWKTFCEGTTIGAKRLSRGSAVKADQVKITVTTSEAAPMISEVGLYKASEGFAVGGITAPDGMDVLDVADAEHFTINGWTLEHDQKFLNGTNIWSSNNNSIQLSFEGTKVYLMGSTKQTSAGTADIYIDGKKAGSFSRVTGKDAYGQVLFASDDLDDGSHTLELKKTSGTISIEAAYVINNSGKGMLELESTAYTMNEDETIEITVNRVGGTNGEITAMLEPNPGSAIQDDFDTTPQAITIPDGESQTTVPVTTRRNTNETGEQYFSIELTNPSEGLIIGFNNRAVVTIQDMEGITFEKLQQLAEECSALHSEHYSGGWAVFQEKLNTAYAILESGDASPAQIQTAYNELARAKDGLIIREKYTADDPFVFPWKAGSSTILEAEFAETIFESNTSEQYQVGVREAAWASNGKYINSLNKNDYIEYPYFAEKAGTYKVTLTYQSGSNNNKVSWSEKDNKIKAGEQSAGASNASEVHTVDFTLEVLEAGSGTLVFTGPAGDSPRLDKFVIEPQNIVLETYTVEASAGEGGTISPEGTTEVTEGNSLNYTITPDSGYAIADVLVNGTSVGAVESYELTDIQADTSIEAVFVFVNYTAENRFQFPTESEGEAKVLEAEHFILTNTGVNESYPLKISSADWASNGKFVNALNANDMITLYYNAEKTGTYKVTVTYRSGDPKNMLVWAEESGKIEAGEVIAGAGDAAKVTHTAEFTFKVLEAGEGTLVFTGPSAQSPQTDKFEIIYMETEVPVPPVVLDTSRLSAQIANAQERLKQTDDYTADDLAGLQTLVEYGQTVLETAETQEAINQAADEIETYMSNMLPIQRFTISASAGEGGTITPDGELVVKAGESLKFEIIPSEGYEVADVVVNGESAGAVTEYTFEAVTADSEITATFKKTEEPVDPDNPDKPVSPDEPDSPVNPDKPTNPDEPDSPVNPDKPTNPDEPDSPVNPDEPSNPDSSSQTPNTNNQNPNGSNGSSAVKTGDGTNVMIWSVLMAAAFTGIVMVKKRRTR